MPNAVLSSLLSVAIATLALGVAPIQARQAVNPQNGGTAQQPGPEVLGLLQHQVRAT